jgi:hypothetical protein
MNHELGSERSVIGRGDYIQLAIQLINLGSTPTALRSNDLFGGIYDEGEVVLH